MHLVVWMCPGKATGPATLKKRTHGIATLVDLTPRNSVLVTCHQIFADTFSHHRKYNSEPLQYSEHIGKNQSSAQP